MSRKYQRESGGGKGQDIRVSGGPRAGKEGQGIQADGTRVSRECGRDGAQERRRRLADIHSFTDALTSGWSKNCKQQQEGELFLQTLLECPHARLSKLMTVAASYFAGKMKALWNEDAPSFSPTPSAPSVCQFLLFPSDLSVSCDRTLGLLSPLWLHSIDLTLSSPFLSTSSPAHPCSSETCSHLKRKREKKRRSTTYKVCLYAFPP